MDVPWGSSPWADEIQHPVNVRRANDDPGGNDGTPKTPVKALELQLEAKADSPWDDENDGFGEWAAIPAAEEVRGNDLGVDGSSDIWAPQQATVTTSAVKNSNFVGLNWNSEVPSQDDSISRFAQDLAPISPTDGRQPFPDPWITETTLKHEEHTEDIPELKARKHSAGNTADVVKSDIFEATAQPLQETKLHPFAEFLPAPAETILESRTANGHVPGKPDEQGLGPESLRTAEDAVDIHDADRESSRRSSSPSQQSHHDEILPESPRTSLDDEPKRPQALRKVSSKIQELVEHFDGLAKPEEDVVVEQSSGRIRVGMLSVRTGKVAEEEEQPAGTGSDAGICEEDDFGDFEDGKSKAMGNLDEDVNPPVTPPSIQHQHMSSRAFTISSIQSSPTTSRPTTSRPTTSGHVKETYGRIEFAVKSSDLNEFYFPSGGDAAHDAAGKKVFIVDTVPLDSFQTLEEHKTWYRVSRYGSMRKHNSGDEDNYVRIAWSQSQIREQTLKTVARWLEEDRLSGRVILGGGSKGSSSFGWNDPNSQPVSLASALGAKQARKSTPIVSITEIPPQVPRGRPESLMLDRSRSKSRSPPKSSELNSARGKSISESHKGNLKVPEAVLGWKASPTIGQQSTVLLTRESVDSAVSPRKSTGDLQPTTSINSTPVATILSKMPADLTSSQTATGSELSISTLFPTLPPISNDDEDWGETVPSLGLSIAPDPPHPQSLNRVSSPPKPISNLESPKCIQSLGRSHKTNTSFDDVLVPKHRGSSDPTSDPFSWTTLMPLSTSLSPSVEPVPPSPMLAPSTHDPWTSVDFSFFDSPASPPGQKLVSLLGSGPTSKVSSFVKDHPERSPLRHGMTRQEVEQDQIVASIVETLPDLSYMLRR